MCAVLAFLLFTVGGSSCASQSSSWQSPAVVRIESNEAVMSVFPLHWLTGSSATDGQAMLLRDGDYVGTEEGDELVFRYRASDGVSLRVDFNHRWAKLGAVVVAVNISDDSGLGWLEKASDGELASLRSVGFKGDFGAAATAALKRLAAVNPNVDIIYDINSGVAGATTILPLFRPKIAVVNPKLEPLLMNRPEVDTVVIEAKEPGALAVLPRFPGLRRLVISFDEKAGPLPADLAGLRSLIVMSELNDLSLIATAPAELEELSLDADDLADIKQLERFTKLHTLWLLGDRGSAIDLGPLSKLKELRRVTLPAGTTDAQFAAFIADHPNLAVIEMTENSDVTSLQPLTTLKKLEAIVIDGERKDIGVLGEVKSLRFVGLSRRARETAGEAQLEALRKALPEALIVAITPFCLGSGWILALVPTLFLAWFVRHRARRRSL
jgi:hypothetical protein